MADRLTNINLISREKYNELPDPSKNELWAVETPVVVETYKNGMNWYRIYSDGWIEQGGIYESSETSVRTINLLKEMANTNYNIQAVIYGDQNDRAFRVKPESTTAFICQIRSTGSQANTTGNISWLVMGYGA